MSACIIAYKAQMKLRPCVSDLSRSTAAALKVIAAK